MGRAWPLLTLFFLACLGAGGHAVAATTFQAAGTAVSGTGAVIPAWPAHVVGDIALLFVESTGGQSVTLSVPAGFAVVPNSPQSIGAGTAGTRLSVFWARATSVSMPSPTVADPGNHVYARILTYRGAPASGDPWDVTGGGVRSLTQLVLGSVTTTVANTRLVQIASRGNDSAGAAFSAQANPNLTGIAERSDAGTGSGNGGGIGVWDGVMAAAGATGTTTATTIAAATDNAYLTVALKPQAGPRYQAAGRVRSGTGNASPPWPAHAVGDVALLFVESTGGQAANLSVPAGFAPVASSPQATGAGTAGTRITVFWARATSTSMATPTVTDPGNHVYARIIIYRGVASAGNPWNVTAGGAKAAASTSVSVTGVTTTVASTLVVQAVARDNDNAAAAFSAQANASLTGITERSDAGTTSGNGGGFAVWDGFKATAGATGNTTATVTNSINAFITIALAPDAAALAPAYQAAGAQRSGTGAVTPPWPAHAVGDVALLVVESTGGQPATLSTPAGFMAVANSPQSIGAGTAGTRLTVFWARATSTSMPSPTVADPGDHVYARIITYRGVANAGNPWDVTGGGIRSAAALYLDSVTTTVPALVVQAATRDNDSAAVAFSAQTNASLTGIAERSDGGTTSGNGGGFAVWDGTLGTAGATGVTSATVLASNNAYLTIALKSVVGPDHYEMSLQTASLACLASPVTVIACADSSSPCTSNFTGASGTTATLAASAGTLGTPTVIFDAAGVASTTLSHPAAADGTPATVTLSAEQMAAVNPRKCCPDGAGCVVADSCSTTFNTAGFIFSASVGGAAATIPAQTAGVASGTYYLRAVKTSTTTQACESALAGPNTVNFAYECVDPATCYTSDLMSVNGGAATTIARNDNGSVTSYTSVAMTFDANGNAPFTFNYSDSGQIRLYAAKAAAGSLLTALSGPTNAFVTKPYAFTLAAVCTADSTANAADQATPGPGDPKFCRAGRAFDATVTAIANGGATTYNYGRETTPETVAVAWVHYAPTGAGTSAGTPPSGSFTHVAGYTGAFTASGLSWDEVGILGATVSVGDGSYLGAGDVTSTIYVGRFYPDHFDTAPAGQCGGFAYSGRPGAPVVTGQPFTVVATAKNGAGGTTVNYANATGYAKAADLTVTSGGGTGTLYVDATAGGSSAIPASKFALGVGTASHSDATGKVSFVFSAFPTAATDIQLHAEDADTTPSTVGSYTDGILSIRAGRLWLGNAYGSDRQSLQMRYDTQYWNGSAFVTNAGDICTSFAPANIGLGNYQVGITPANMGIDKVTVGAIGAGTGFITLSNTGLPAVGTSGSVDLVVDLGGTTTPNASWVPTVAPTAGANLPWLRSKWYGAAWDRDPLARATFGVFGSSLKKGPIYLRESH